MIGAKVGKRYAVAIYDIAAGENKVTEIYETLNSIMETYLENLEFKNLVAHPLISKEDKKEFVKKVFPNFDEVEMDIVNYLIDRNRLLVETKTGKKINLTVKIDSSIIAGGILKIGDEITDGSIKRQLETLWKK